MDWFVIKNENVDELTEMEVFQSFTTTPTRSYYPIAAVFERSYLLVETSQRWGLSLQNANSAH